MINKYICNGCENIYERKCSIVVDDLLQGAYSDAPQRCIYHNDHKANWELNIKPEYKELSKGIEKLDYKDVGNKKYKTNRIASKLNEVIEAVNKLMEEK